jgi:2-haloalkanoic acid dehalogenase type II
MRRAESIRHTTRVRYEAIGFDLLTALLDTWTVWSAVAGERAVGMRWHGAAQALLRGQRYRAYEDVVREAAVEVGLERSRADVLFARWDDFAPWPDVPSTLTRLDDVRRFIVTNCSRALGRRAASRVGHFALVVTAEDAGAYKPDPLPYRMALERIGLDAAQVLFVAGSAHDVGGAARVGMDVYWANRGNAQAPSDGVALREEPDFRGLLETAGAA